MILLKPSTQLARKPHDTTRSVLLRSRSVFGTPAGWGFQDVGPSSLGPAWKIPGRAKKQILRNLWTLWKTQDSIVWNLWKTLIGRLFGLSRL